MLDDFFGTVVFEEAGKWIGGLYGATKGYKEAKSAGEHMVLQALFSGQGQNDQGPDRQAELQKCFKLMGLTPKSKLSLFACNFFTS
jgi:hypothetical protein